MPLLTNGYTRNAVVSSGMIDSGTHLLPKPFGIDALYGKVHSVLDD